MSELPSAGNDIKQLIWQCVAGIPEGKVVSYGRIARDCGYPSHARYVGTVLRQLPSGTSIPWHRVINGKGEIAFESCSDQYIEQRQRLESEGVIFNSLGKITLADYEP